MASKAAAGRSAASVQSTHRTLAAALGASREYEFDQPYPETIAYLAALGMSGASSSDRGLLTNTAGARGMEFGCGESMVVPSAIEFLAALGSSRVAISTGGMPTALAFLEAIGSGRTAIWSTSIVFGLPMATANDRAASHDVTRYSVLAQCPGNLITAIWERPLPSDKSSISGSSQTAERDRATERALSASSGLGLEGDGARLGPGKIFANTNGRDSSASREASLSRNLSSTFGRSTQAAISRAVTTVIVGARGRLSSAALERSPLYAFAGTKGAEASACLDRLATRAVASSLGAESSAVRSRTLTQAAIVAYGASREASVDRFGPATVYARSIAREVTVTQAGEFAKALAGGHTRVIVAARDASLRPTALAGGRTKAITATRDSGLRPNSLACIATKDYVATWDRANLTCTISASGRSFRITVMAGYIPSLSPQAEARVMISQAARGRVRIN